MKRDRLSLRTDERELGMSAIGPEPPEDGAAEIVAVDPGGPRAAFIEGMRSLREGRFDAAVERLSGAVAVDAQNAEYLFGLGAALIGAGRADDAYACYERGLALHPHHAEAQNDMGNLLAGRGRMEEAIGCYHRALAVNPGFHQARYNLGVILARSCRLDEAAACFEQALQGAPQLAGAARNLGTVRAVQGRTNEAIAAFERAVELRGDDADLHNELGILLVRRRRFPEAIARYQEALRLRPDFADAHNNLGNALRQAGKLDEAIPCYQEALRLRPHYPEAYNNLGIALKHKGKLDEAIWHYQEALRLKPDYAEAFHNLGLAHASRGQLDASMVCFQQAARLRPDYVEAHHHWGNALADRGRLAEAVERYRAAVRLRPDNPVVHKSLGAALAKMEKYDEAIAEFLEALRLRPAYPEACNDLGITYSRQGRFEEAAVAYRQAVQHRARYPEAHNNLGNALRNLGRFDESLPCYRRAIELNPKYADAHNNLGIAYAELGRFAEAVASYTECIRLRPNHVNAHMNRALTWLRMGEFDLGWAEYEWRWKKRSLSSRPLYTPQWNGFSLAGRRILLITEQGFGDTFQFIRYAPLLKEQGATVMLECPEKLMKVLGRCPGIDRMIAVGSPRPEHDVHIPLLTVAGLINTTLEKLPATVPYVHPDPGLLASWRDELAQIDGFKVGINWQGNPKYAGDFHRSIPLAHFEPLARVPGVRLISLQQNFGIEQLEQLDGRFPVIELGSRLDRTTGSFMDTAAVMKNLDLFITSDTAVAHLAGALGIPVWLMLSSTPDWRWSSTREDCPWYPTMRLFRQAEHRQWGPVFQRVAAELARIVPPDRLSPRAGLPVEVAPGELLDKFTILQIKSERIDDPDKLRHVRRELAILSEARGRSDYAWAEVADLEAELKAVNEALWTIEDEIRDCERAGDFGAKFIELARSVYKTNDRRAAIKRRINGQLGSEIVEEKSYAGGQPAGTAEPACV